jgi:hypothetical protein
MLMAVLCGGAILAFSGWYFPKVEVTCMRTAVAAAAQCTLAEQGHFTPMQSSDFLLDGARIEPVTSNANGSHWSRMRITTTTHGPLALPVFDVSASEEAELRAGLAAFQASPSRLQFEGGYSTRYLTWAGALFTALGILALTMYVARKGGIRETLLPLSRPSIRGDHIPD